MTRNTPLPCCLLLFTLLTACARLPAHDAPLPATSKSSVVVFDIDGTLTPRPLSLYGARPDAARVARWYSENGYTVVYLTARMAWLQRGIPGWLQRNGFPQGELHTAQDSEDGKHPDIYKARVLAKYRALGWAFEAAYGDSSTDFQAYAAAGIEKSRIFALARAGQTQCQTGAWQRCLQGWTEQLTVLQK